MQCYDELPPAVRRQLQEMSIDVQNLPNELLGAICNGWAPSPPQIVADIKRLDANLRAQFPQSLGAPDGLRKPGPRNDRS